MGWQVTSCKGKNRYVYACYRFKNDSKQKKTVPVVAELMARLVVLLNRVSEPRHLFFRRSFSQEAISLYKHDDDDGCSLRLGY